MTVTPKPTGGVGMNPLANALSIILLIAILGAAFILFGWNSYIVEGTPLIDPTLIKAGEARPSDYMVSYQDPATKAQKLAYVSQEEYAQVKQAIRSNDGAKVQSILAAH